MKPQSKQSLYRVEFEESVAAPFRKVVICDDVPEFEVAVGFALNLHRSSNVSHVICVLLGDKVEIMFRRD